MQIYSRRDFSEFRQSERARIEAEDLCSTLLNQVPDPVLIHIGGKVVFANDQLLGITGMDNAGILGKNLVDLLTDPADPVNNEVIRNLARGSLSRESDFEIRTANRKVVIKNFRVRNSRIRYKECDAILTILIDITERKHLENYILNRVMETEEQDRKRFAADLHDDLGPILSSIKLHLGLLEAARGPEKHRDTLRICNEQLNEAITKMRLVANNLMPRLLESFGLEAAIGSFIKTVQHDGLFSVTLVSNLKGKRFPGHIELHLYRILCELITNTIKHAGATNAILKLGFSKGMLVIRYSDNGKGYDVVSVSHEPGGMGMGNIQQRAGLAEAKIQFLNRKGKTEVVMHREF